MPRVSREKLQLYDDLNVVFETEPGKRILEWFRVVCGEGETLTREEQMNEARAGEPNFRFARIDPNAFFLREGMRRGYRKLALMIEEAQKKKEKAAK